MAGTAYWKASVSAAAFVAIFAGSGMAVQAADKEVVAEALASTPAVSAKRFPGKLEAVAMKRAVTKANGGTIYEIGVGDKLRIKFFQRDELSGEFRVRADGNISLPLIGSLPVRGRTPVELEQLISSKFFEMTSRSAFAVVDVIERRPFFVAGDVNRPGTFQYVPRMTVVHAIAIAGGVYRMPQAANQMMDITREQWRLRSASADAAIQLAKRERLRALLNGDDEVVFPSLVSELVGKQQAVRIERTQRRLFKQALAWNESRQDFLKQALSLAEDELKVLRERLTTMSETLKVHGAELKTTQGLFKRGLTQRRNVYQKKYAISNLETNAANVRAEIKRAELRRIQAVKNLAEFAPDEQRKIALELDGVEADFEASLRNIAASKSVISQAGMPTAGVQTASFGHVTRTYTILRSVQGKMVEINANEHDRLLPGDVLKVSLSTETTENRATKVIEARAPVSGSEFGPLNVKVPDPSATGRQSAELLASISEIKQLLVAQSSKLKAVEKSNEALAREVTEWRTRYETVVQKGLPTVPDTEKLQPIEGRPAAPTLPQESSVKGLKSTIKTGLLIPLPVQRPLQKVAVQPTRTKLPLRAQKLVVSLQSELKRVGCYTGQVDGLWGPLSRGAMARFGQTARANRFGSAPSLRAFLVVKQWRTGSCKSRLVARANQQ